MRARQGSTLEALRRTKDFLDANGPLFEAVNKSSARRKLDEITAQLTKHGVTQDGSTRATSGETSRQRTLRAVLRSERMRPIAEVARQQLRSVPEFPSLKMPRGNPSNEALVMSARGMADAAKLHAAVLIENGLRDDFIDQLLSAAAALEKSIDARNASKQTKAGSTAGLRAEERRGRSILRVLDAALRPKLVDDETLSAAWDTARYVKRTRSVVATPPAITPAPTVLVAPTAAVSAAEVSVTPQATAEAA